MLFCVRKWCNDIGCVLTCIVMMEQNVIIVLIMKWNKLCWRNAYFNITIYSEFCFPLLLHQWVVGKIYPGKMNIRVTLSFNLIINKWKMSFSTIELFPFLWLLFLYLISLKFYCDLNNNHKSKIRINRFPGYIELKT